MSALKVVMNWSSGKDAALAFHLLSGLEGYKVTHLLTTLSEEHERVFMHGVGEQLLEMQAERMSLPLLKVKLPASPDDNLYKDAMLKNLTALKAEGVSVAAYGDIFLEDLKVYREQQLSQVGMSALFPLWKKDTKELVRMVEDAGIEAILVCVNERVLGKEFLGRKIGRDLLTDLPAGVDSCGENGEFHTFVYNAPFFNSPIPIKTGEIVYKKYTPEGDGKGWDTGFYFLDVNCV
jgi:uncharacterized protein (TIGR00290 family)